MVETIVATFLGCAMVTYWLLSALVQFFLCFFRGLKSLVLSFLFEYKNWSFH